MRDRYFLLDENIDPKTASYLGKEGIKVEHVRDVLWQGADDEEDVIPYAREHDLIVVTSDLRDFGSLEPHTAPGIVILYDDTMPAYQIATWRLSMIDAYGSREQFAGREVVDDWV